MFSTLKPQDPKLFEKNFILKPFFKVKILFAAVRLKD